MVANSFFGRSNNFEMILNAWGCSSRPVSISDFSRENNATSAPEIKAEKNKRTHKSSNSEMNETSTENMVNTKLGGSGSKI